jgi:DNA polymerase I
VSEILTNDPRLCGAGESRRVVAVEHKPSSSEHDEMLLFTADAGRTSRTVPFRSWILAQASACGECPVEHEQRRLEGPGSLNRLMLFDRWSDLQKARKWLVDTTGYTATAPKGPYFTVNDPVQQYCMLSGETLFKGMRFADLRRLQFDIECYTVPGFEFCNPEREGDRIIAIALCDSSGWTEVLSGEAMDEKTLLERFVACVRERDPDVLEGHNVFNFDLHYIAVRAKRWKVKLALGRDGSVPRIRPSRMSVGERTLAYDRADVFGRHVIDTMFLLQAYDVSHRTLPGYGLKDAAIHFGLAAANRTYIEGSEIARTFDEDAARVMRYVLDDVKETRALSDLLSQSNFVQAQMLPYSYQNVSVRGTASKIDAMMVREYLRRGYAVPLPDDVQTFAGGYTDMFVQGIIENVHHCDVRSLYPSLMLKHDLAPATDELGVFLEILEVLKAFRVQAKTAMQEAGTAGERAHVDALQTTFKILINSFYGYLGFSQARFSDFKAAARVTQEGRDLLQAMIDWMRRHGAVPVEIDTDGIYFVPPEACRGEDAAHRKCLDAFRAEFMASLPEGIEIEFDGEYRSMYSYKMKNYALLARDGEMIIKGAALKSRGLEPFQRSFLEQMIRMQLEEREDQVPVLAAEYADAIREGRWPVSFLAKTESLQESPDAYAAKRDRGKTPRRAVYELALQSGRDYRAGDQVSYYVTGNRKSVKVHEAARLVSDWDPARRDENVPYYLSKLEALQKKFSSVSAQTELKLE